MRPADAAAAAGLLLNALLDQEIGRMIRADIDFANVAVNSSVRENSPDTRGYRTIALVGVDSRDESEAGGNSDTMMILSIHKDTGEVRIASLYRDTYLRIGQGGLPEGQRRLQPGRPGALSEHAEHQSGSEYHRFCHCGFLRHDRYD